MVVTIPIGFGRHEFIKTEALEMNNWTIVSLILWYQPCATLPGLSRNRKQLTAILGDEVVAHVEPRMGQAATKRSPATGVFRKQSEPDFLKRSAGPVSLRQQGIQESPPHY